MLEQETLSDKRIVVKEIHRLQNPSGLPKTAAGLYARTRIVATGSSTPGRLEEV
jgi:hypothetical protein